MPRHRIAIASQIRAILFSSGNNILLYAVPAGFALAYTRHDGRTSFVVNFVAIIPLAVIVSYSTEEIALRVGETLGGLLNASFGNVVEFLVLIQAVVQGEIVIAKTSLIDNILSNLLLFTGMFFLFRGIQGIEQYFNVTIAQTAVNLLTLSIGSLVVPMAFRDWIPGLSDNDLQNKVESLLRDTFIIILMVYGCYQLFRLKSHRSIYNKLSRKVKNRRSSVKATTGGYINLKNSMQEQKQDEEENEVEELRLTPIIAIIALSISTTLAAFCSKFMVNAIDDITDTGSIVSKTFIGLILLSVIGNAAEHAIAITAVSSKYWLAMTLFQLERYEDAKELFQQALQGQGKSLGKEHSHTLSSKHWLAMTLFELERYEDAKELFQQALQGQEKSLGKEHSRTLSSKYWLARTLFELETLDVVRFAGYGPEPSASEHACLQNFLIMSDQTDPNQIFKWDLMMADNGGSLKSAVALLDSQCQKGNWISQPLLERLGKTSNISALSTEVRVLDGSGRIVTATGLITLEFKRLQGQRYYEADFFVFPPSTDYLDVIFGAQYIVKHGILVVNPEALLPLIAQEKISLTEEAAIALAMEQQRQQREKLAAGRTQLQNSSQQS